jgi:hypothetical protein
MRRLALSACIGFALLAGQAMAKDRYGWDYSEAHTGLLMVYDLSVDDPPYPDMSMACDRNGDLLVEARGLSLWNDVDTPSVDPEDLQTLTLETDGGRLEAPLEPVRTSYSGWARARFANGASFADNLSESSFLVVRAVNRTPVSERDARDTDLAVAYPPLDYQKSEPFRSYCKTVASRAR